MDNTISDRMRYFLENYDVAFTYVQDKNSTEYIIDPVDKVCRFCGRRYPDVRFKKKAHAISESLGNKECVLRNECDDCNEKFGDMLEDQLCKYLGVSRTVSQIAGKHGVPTYRSKDKKNRVEFDPDLGIIIKEVEGSDFTELKENRIIIHAVRDKYTPLAVYKAFVKMSLSLIDYKYMPHFIETTSWIREPSQLITRFHDLPQYGMVIERFVPGPKPLPLRATGFIRKNDCIKLPYYQFYLEFANYSYQMVIPCPVKDQGLEEINILRVPGTDEQIELSEWASLLENAISINPDEYMSDFRKQFGMPVVHVRNFTSAIPINDEPLDISLGYEALERHNESIGLKVEDVILEEKNRNKES